jgi:hypothetical protein
VLDGLVTDGLVFFGIWRAWMNFTWFAMPFDADDWLYRMLTIVQMAGVLVPATGIEPDVPGRITLILLIVLDGLAVARALPDTTLAPHDEEVVLRGRRQHRPTPAVATGRYGKYPPRVIQRAPAPPVWAVGMASWLDARMGVTAGPSRRVRYQTAAVMTASRTTGVR